GMVYDWQNSAPEDVDMWIKKVFPEDITTRAEETPDPNDSDAAVFPNPGDDWLMLWTLRDHMMFEMYDPSGRRVITKMMELSGRHRISTANLVSGSYYYRFLDASTGQVVHSGTWIRK
ncbi:MAG: hypothetical protein JW861_03095, partial [Bacteroidales bacterium]|nr:hypothetical protein [Bacteroidales bacterium]